MPLRKYQLDAVNSVYTHLKSGDGNPCIVIPTGGGKTHVMARICQDAVTRWKGRVLILAHVKELLEQTTSKVQQNCPDIGCGVYSAGLKRRDTKQPIIVAGIQSVYKRACELGKFDLIMVDEAHLIPPDGDGMYRQFLDDANKINPKVRIIGLTATPYRLKSGDVCTPDGYLNHVCYKVGVSDLIRQGHLCPLTSKPAQTRFDTSGLKKLGGEFVATEAEALMDQEQPVVAACRELVEQTTDRHSVLIFTCGIQHGQHVADVLKQQHGIECGFIHSKTKPRDRERILKSFRSGDLRYLCNVNVLTTGFDAPNVDCVVLLRPTASTGLYYQMVGRGFRLNPGKQDCLILDFGGNIERHGPVDELLPEVIDRQPGQAKFKDCPGCSREIANGYQTCPHCGHRFPDREKQMHGPKPSVAQILSQPIPIERFEVRDEQYFVHTKRGAGDDDPKTLRVEYRLGLNHYEKEYICFEHTGFPRLKAERWWRLRNNEPVPATAKQAMEIIEAGGLARTQSIHVQQISSKKFDKIKAYEIGPIPKLLSSASGVPS